MNFEVQWYDDNSGGWRRYGSRPSEHLARQYAKELERDIGVRVRVVQKGSAQTVRVNLADVSAKELALGMQAEREYVEDKARRREIVLGHLSEDPHYYSNLARAR